MNMISKKWETIMNPTKNVLKNMPNDQRFVVSSLLSCLWSLAFCIYIGEYLSIAPYMMGHIALICAISATIYVFNQAKRYSK